MMVISRRPTVRWLAQCLLSVAALESAFAADESAMSPRQCAARDLQILTIMEERGEANVVPHEQLRAEMFILQEARSLCALHLIPEALAVYDRVLVDRKLIAVAPAH